MCGCKAAELVWAERALAPQSGRRGRGGAVTHLAADFKEADVSGPQMKEQLAKKATVKATFIFRTVAVAGLFYSPSTHCSERYSALSGATVMILRSPVTR